MHQKLRVLSPSESTIRQSITDFGEPLVSTSTPSDTPFKPLSWRVRPPCLEIDQTVY